MVAALWQESKDRRLAAVAAAGGGNGQLANESESKRTENGSSPKFFLKSLRAKERAPARDLRQAHRLEPALHLVGDTASAFRRTKGEVDEVEGACWTLNRAPGPMREGVSLVELTWWRAAAAGRNYRGRAAAYGGYT